LLSSVLWRPCRQAFKYGLIAGFATLSGLVQADINTVTVTPSSANLQYKTGGTISATWQVNRIETATGGFFTRLVSSPSALLQINGATVATLAGTISKNSNLAAFTSGVVTFNETFSLNAAVTRRIARSPAGSVRIVRTFDDTPSTTPVTASISIFSGGAATGPLTVRRIDLAFENSARTDVVYQGDTVHAIADIAFRSSGILKGEWRIVDPTATLGSSGGRVLRVIRQNLVSAGEGRTRIVSPPLPTKSKGLYLVSFVVDDANTDIDLPILRYFVLDASGAGLATAPAVMNILAPAKGTNLSKDTVFIWEGVQGAQAYQIEIYNPGQAEPLTGKLVPAMQLKSSLSGFSFDWLQADQHYDWRVRAFGAGGKLVAQSEMQLIYLP